MSKEFTVEELTFLEMYKVPKLEQTKEEILRVLPVIEDEDMLNLAKSVLSKLDLLSSEEFNQFDFSNTLKKESVEIL